MAKNRHAPEDQLIIKGMTKDFQTSEGEESNRAEVIANYFGPKIINPSYGKQIYEKKSAGMGPGSGIFFYLPKGKLMKKLPGIKSLILPP